MDKDPKHDYISVLPEQGKNALLLFFMACCIECEGDNVEINPTTHKDGEPLFYGPDFKPYAFYHEGLYLDVSFERPSYVAGIFDKFKPYFGNYMGPDVAQDDDDDDDDVVTERYTFRLTDHLDKQHAAPFYKSLQRWVNMRAIFHKVKTFEEYDKGLAKE